MKEGKKKYMKKDAQITVFLSLIFICIVSLLLLLAESARMAGMQYSVQVAAGSSLDSVMSQYHRELWDEYRILLLDLPEKQIETELRRYLDTYSFGEADIVIEKKIQAADDGAYWVEREIADYMKYGVWVLDFEESEIQDIWDKMAGADGLARAADRFFACTKEALKLEKTVKRLSEIIEKQNIYGEDVREGIASCREYRVKKAGKAYQNENQKIKIYIQTYEKTAEKMREKLEAAKRENQEEKEIGEKVQKMIAEEEARYDSYIALQGERYQKVMEAADLSEKNTRVIQEAMELAESANRENEEGEKETSWQEEENAEDETQMNWSDAAVVMREYETIPILFHKTEGDEKKGELLESLKEWMEGDILTLLLGKNANISKGRIKDKNLPSKRQTERADVTSLPQEVTETISGLWINAYIREYFQNFRTADMQKEIQYEQEYLLAGKSADRENLKAAAEQIVAVRTGLNLLYLYSDAEKREEATSLAMVILGSTGLAPLAPILSFFILSVWAAAEALTDTKILMNGGQVPVWKTRDEWRLSLEGVLNLGAKKGLEKMEEYSINERAGEKSGQADSSLSNGRKKGAGYGEYVRLLLLLKTRKEKLYRMMDMMQMNIGRRQRGFEIGNCYYSIGIRVQTDKQHFFHAGKWAERTFAVQAAVEKAY